MSTQPDPQDRLGQWDLVLPEALPDPEALVGLPVRDAQGCPVGRVVHAEIGPEGLELHAALDDPALLAFLADPSRLSIRQARSDHEGPSARSPDE